MTDETAKTKEEAVLDQWRASPPRIVFVCEFKGMKGMAVGFVVPPKNHTSDGICYDQLSLLAYVRYGEDTSSTIDTMIAVSDTEFLDLSSAEAVVVAEKIRDVAIQHLQGKISLEDFHKRTGQIRPFDYRR